MSKESGIFFTESKAAGANLSARQIKMIIEFLEAEMEHVDRGPQTDDYLNLWRRVASLKVQAAKIRRVNDDQARAYELQIQKARCLKMAANQ